MLRHSACGHSTRGRQGVKALLILLAVAALTGCHKYFDVENETVPGNTLMLEFSKPIKYVLELKINGTEIPIDYRGGSRVLMIEGLPAGQHNFNIHSISYVFGPEFDNYKITDDRGAYFFIQARKYRSGLPKNRAQVSLRAYRRQLKEQGIDAAPEGAGKIKAYFK